MTLNTQHRRAISILCRGPLRRGPRGWRFGLTRVGDAVVDHLVAAGRARVVNDAAAGHRCELAGREEQS